MDSLKPEPEQNCYPPNSEEDDATPTSEIPLSRWQKTYGFLGFQKGYNFPLFVIFAGAMIGFCLARTPYLDVHKFAAGAAPGEWYFYQSGHYRIAIRMHLASVIPSGLLIVWQFVPIIRRKFILFHRINGYIISILLLFVITSGLMLARRSFGGLPPTQTAIGLLAIIIIVSLGMAMYNIKRLQIDQHRAWMLRVAFYCGTIITVRLITFIAAVILPKTGDYYNVFSCDELATLLGSDKLRSSYPQCYVRDATPQSVVPVHASFGDSIATVASSLQWGFSIGMWLAIFLHIVGVEMYLNLTPAESERLRVVSYEKQLKAGFSHPGSAGLTADRWGDAEAWQPPSKKAGEA